MPFRCKTKISFSPIADVIEKVVKEEMADGCITHRIVKEVMPKINEIPYNSGGLHHYAVTGEQIRQVSTQILNPDRYESLSSASDNV